MSKASEIIQRGDPAEIMRMALGAWFAGMDGEYCRCDEPDLHGRDLMCGHCLLENEGQRDRLAALIRGPHAFEPSTRPWRHRMGWCDLCTHPKDDPRHVSTAGTERPSFEEFQGTTPTGEDTETPQ